MGQKEAERHRWTQDTHLPRQNELLAHRIERPLPGLSQDQERRKAMVVGGFELPAAFVQLCEATSREEMPYEWELKANVDAYGQPWDPCNLIIHCDPEQIQSDTELLSNMFDEGRFQHGVELPEEERPEPPPEGWPVAPGVIEDEDFTGVANFVWFASAIDGMVYCFDFGMNPKEPSVVFWDGCWRRVAPNFETFMALFVPLGEAPDRSEEEAPPPPQLTDELYAAIFTPRKLLAAWTRGYMLASQPGLRPFFEDIASQYAACNAEERREVEAEVREELVRRGMTDEQRRTLDELWERLQATQRSN
jgi:hypothetical protein